MGNTKAQVIPDYRYKQMQFRWPYGELNNCQIIILAAKEELTPSWKGDSDEGMGELLARWTYYGIYRKVI